MWVEGVGKVKNNIHGLTLANKVKAGEFEREEDKVPFGHAYFEGPLENANGDVWDAVECMLWAEAKLQQLET